MRARFWVALVALSLVTSSALAKGDRCKAMLKRIDQLLDLYEHENPAKHYPSTLREFEKFAARKGKPLDLTMFSEFDYTRSKKRLMMSYTCKETGQGAAEARSHLIVY